MKPNVTFAGKPVNLVGSLPQVGDKAADFSLIAQDLSAKTLSDFDGKIKVIAIYLLIRGFVQLKIAKLTRFLIH
jgi:thiol peroxidase